MAASRDSDPGDDRTETSPLPSQQAADPSGLRARAILRAEKIKEEALREAGGPLDLDDVMALLKTSKEGIAKRVQDGTLLAVPGPDSSLHYPAAQFTADGTAVRGLKDVRDALPTKNPWTVLNFFVTPDDYLNGRKPIELLREGRVEVVAAAAHRYGEQGA